MFIPGDGQARMILKGRSVMRFKQGFWIALLVVILLNAVWIDEGRAQDEPAHSMPVWFGTEVSIAPDRDGAGIWKCQATLEDLTSGEVLSAPAIVFAAGEEASVQSGLPSEMVWELRVEVADDASEAKWLSRITLGDQVLSVSSGDIRLSGE